MSSKVLEDCLRDILGVIMPVNNDWIVRFQVIEELREVVSHMDSLRGATVEPFGSFVSNLFMRSGDLDISIELANGLFISSSGKKEKQRLLKILMKAMKRKAGWNKFESVPHAKVPILKVESKNISCDISIDNLQAQMKSKFLFWITAIDTRFRDMVLLVKEWAKAQNINNPKAGTFNSYSLSLLVVFHFQTCSPVIFPPLKDIYPGNIADELQGVRADAVNRIEETCTQNIARFRSDRQRALNRSSLSELFIAFLAKFSNISARASDLGICPFTGQWEYIRNNTRWLPQNHAIYIEDPFEQPQNSARAVNDKRKLERISEAFKSSHERLLSVNQNNNSVLALATIAQHQTTRLIHQQRTFYPPAPVQPQYRPPSQRSTVDHYALVEPRPRPPPQRSTFDPYAQPRPRPPPQRSTFDPYAPVEPQPRPLPQSTFDRYAPVEPRPRPPPQRSTFDPYAPVEPRPRPRNNHRSQNYNSTVTAQGYDGPTQHQMWRPRPSR